MNSHHDALEYDLACKGIDLQDFWRGRITLRRLWVLIKGLPSSSAFWCAAAGHDERWTPTDYLLANTVDLLAAAHFKDVKPIPRPGEAEAIERKRAERMKRYLDREQKEGRG